jgi:hypothetical protein
MPETEPVDPAPEAPVEPPLPPRIVHITSQPPGAAIFSEGEAQGETPGDVAIPEGAQILVVELRRRGFESQQTELTRDGPAEVAVTLVRRPRAATVPELAPR